MTSWHSSGSPGYALPLVLVAMAVFLLYAGETSSRTSREVRVAMVEENSDLAFYAADAGFNRVRARIIQLASHDQIMALNDRSDTLTYIDPDTGETWPGGTYTLKVTPLVPGTKYQVVSTGTYGEGRLGTQRVVSGTVEVTGTVMVGGVVTKYKVTTTYTP